MSENMFKYMIIESIGDGFWYEMHNVLAHLLEAELLHRIPVVHWGRNCLYSVDEKDNAFEAFFMPVSECCISEITRKEADVIICDRKIDMVEVMCRIPEDHPLYGHCRRDLFSIMLKKYIKLRPNIAEEIEIFYNANMAGTSNIAVHIRSSDKIVEVGHLHELNEHYPEEINKALEKYKGANIFLMTDCKEILENYKKIYGERIIHTDCKRVMKNDIGVHFHEFSDKKLKGLEIVKDTWLAARCDYFIGNGYSNVSMAVSELKDWDSENIKLIY